MSFTYANAASDELGKPKDNSTEKFNKTVVIQLFFIINKGDNSSLECDLCNIFSSETTLMHQQSELHAPAHLCETAVS